MSNTQAGTYKAKVVDVGLEVVGEKNLPVLKVWCMPSEMRQGPVFVAGEFKKLNKAYFLSERLIEKGSFAGRTEIEVVRDQLKETFDYEGSLNPEELMSIVGKDVEIVVENNKEGYANIKWINKPGAGPKRAAKALPADILARLNASFMGVKKEEGAAPDANSFFASLKNGG